MGRAVEVTRIRGAFGCALTVDVEEWYHNCLVPSYVQPRLRPDLPVELDRLLPGLAGLLGGGGARGPFFLPRGGGGAPATAGARACRGRPRGREPWLPSPACLRA